jgi:hypothetical protein
MNTIKNEGFVLNKILFVFEKCAGNICVMQRRIQMVDRMVSIIPAILIVDVVDAVKHAAKMSIRIGFINKGVLCPIAHHHNKPGIDHWHDKQHKGGFEIDKTHEYTKRIKGELSRAESNIDFFSFAMEQIHKGVNYAER